jgi:hypothetical protein
MSACGSNCRLLNAGKWVPSPSSRSGTGAEAERGCLRSKPCEQDREPANQAAIAASLRTFTTDVASAMPGFVGVRSCSVRRQSERLALGRIGHEADWQLSGPES